MGGAKESPRQKMINLMYLVFISMLALNMSKEVLSAFGMISEQVTENNISLQERIVTFETSIESNYQQEGKIWKEKNLDTHLWKIKYYKGLGTSTSKEAGEYFKVIESNIIDVVDNGSNPDILLAFSKDKVNDRKIWLSNYNPDSILQLEPPTTITIKDFIHQELIHFSNYDNIRSIPSICDGFKPSQRKVLHTCLKKNITNETKIAIQLNLDGTGKSNIDTGLAFFDHMLDQIARHGQLDLNIKVDGDLEVDEHHTIEDTAIALGELFNKALGNKLGIERYGFCLPMDDCYAQAAIDFGGRNWLVWEADFKREIIQPAFSKKELTYLENKYLFSLEVLESDEYLNDNIEGRYFKKDFDI